MKLSVRILAACMLVLAGAASAQPAQTPPPKPLPPPAQPAGPAAEEAPPIDVAPPPPVVTPPAPIDIQPIPDDKPAPKAKTQPVAKTVEPLKRVRAGSAIVQALDKVTAETLRFEVPVGQSVRYKSLVFAVRACESAAPDETIPESAAYLTITSQPKPQPGRPSPPTREVFKGWMFASSPGLNPLRHPVYDAWLIACKAA
jgi:hypothetical protein